MADGSVIIDTKLDEGGLGDGLSSLGAKIESGIATAVKAATAALAALGGYAVKVGSDYEAAIAGVAATMGKTVDEIDVISDKAKELGASTAFSASEAAEGFNILAQSGLDMEQQLNSIDATLALAAAGEMTMAESAGFLTTTIKAMSMQVEDASYIADIYAKGATLANTSTTQFGEAVSSAASMAGAYNQSLETTGTALLLLAEKGYQGSVAGTYLSRAMTDLYAPTDNAAKAMEALGVSAYDGEGKQKDFLTVINEVNDALAQYSEEEKAAYTGAIFTTAGVKAFNSIAANSAETIEQFKDNLIDCTGAAQSMADTKLDNLQGDLTILKSAAEGFGISLYEGVNAPLRDLVQYGTSLIDELNEAVKEGGFAGLAEALGDVLAQAITKISEYIPKVVELGVTVVDSLLEGLGNSSGQIAEIAVQVGQALITGFGNITTSLVDVGAQIIGNFAATLAASAPEIIAAITDVFLGLGDVIAKSVVPNAKKVAEAGIQIVRAISEGLVNALPALIGVGKEIVSTIIQAVVELVPELVEQAGEIVQLLCDALIENVPLLLEAAEELFGALLEALPAVIDALVVALPQIVQTIVDTLTALIPQIIQCGTNLLTALVAALPAVIQAIVAVLPQIVQSIADGLLALLPAIIDCGVQLFTALVQALPQIIETILGVLPQIIDSIVSTLTAAIPQLIDCGIQLLTALITALPEIIAAICDVLPDIIDSIVNGLLELLPMLVDCGIQLLTALVDALPEILQVIAEALPVIIESIISGLLQLLPQIIDCGIQLFMALIAALPEIIQAICDALPDIIGGIIDALLEMLPQLIECGVQLFMALIEALPEIITAICQALPQIINSIIDALMEMLPMLIEAGITLFLSLIKELPYIIVELVKAVPQIIGAIVEGFGSLLGSIVEVGKNIVRGLWEGIQSLAGWIWDKVSGWASSLWDGICDFFGIHSPSKLFKDELGKNLMLGLAIGIDDNADETTDAMEKMQEDLLDAFDANEMVAHVKTVVDEAQNDAYDSVSASKNFPRGTEDDEPGEDEGNEEDGGNKPRYVENVITIDGKETARVLTPYVEKELAWRDK